MLSGELTSCPRCSRDVEIRELTDGGCLYCDEENRLQAELRGIKKKLDRRRSQ